MTRHESQDQAAERADAATTRARTAANAAWDLWRERETGDDARELRQAEANQFEASNAAEAHAGAAEALAEDAAAAADSDEADPAQQPDASGFEQDDDASTAADAAERHADAAEAWLAVARALSVALAASDKTGQGSLAD